MKPIYKIGNRKVVIIGAGFVGSSIAYELALRDIAREIVLIDINKEKCAGEAYDVRHGIPSMGIADLYVSNPVDILTQKVKEWMNLPDGMVFGSGCILDTSRFIRCVADYLNLSTGVINGYLVGEHGNNQVPVWSKLVVSGIPIKEYCQEIHIEWNDKVTSDIAEKTRAMGTEIMTAKGKTHYGITISVCFIADAIIN